MNSPRLLHDVLNSIKKIGSPQLNAYLEYNLMSRPIYLSFRFEGLDINDSLYLRLINLVTNFDGKVAWCMYNYRSTKNYVIEPLIFYSRRREIRSGDDKKLVSSFDKDRYIGITEDAIDDLKDLCGYIKQNI